MMITRTPFDEKYNEVTVEGKRYRLTLQMRYRRVVVPDEHNSNFEEYSETLQQLAVGFNFMGLEEDQIWVDVPIIEIKEN
jgi:hypothetical protein